MAIFAKEYDINWTYKPDDLVMYNKLLFTCLEQTSGPWDGSKWAKTTVIIYKENESQDKILGVPAEYYATWADPTGDATAVAANILQGKTAYIWGENEKHAIKATGTMPNNGIIEKTITKQNDSVTIEAGYTTGGTVTAAVATEEKVVTTGGTVLPSEGYLLSKVEVNIEDYAGEVE